MYGLRNSELSTCNVYFNSVIKRVKQCCCTLILLPKSTLNANLTTSFTLSTRPTVLRSASNMDLFLPRSRLKFGERAFRIVAPKVWNTLPLNIRQISNTQTSKRNLNTVLFCTSYNIPTPTLSPADWHSMWFSYCNCFIVFYCILAYFIMYFTA